MVFKRARTEAQVLERKIEILNACAKLYDEHGIDGVHFKAISKMTTFTRPTIYNYYKSKEEILLELLLEDMKVWDNDIHLMNESNETLTKAEYCRKITDIYIKNDRMMRLLSIQISNLEDSCSIEKLADFKGRMSQFDRNFILGLEKFFPEASDEDRSLFHISSSAMVLGLYPHAHLSDKQKKAIELSGADHIDLDFSHFCYNGLMMLLSDIC